MLVAGDPTGDAAFGSVVDAAGDDAAAGVDEETAGDATGLGVSTAEFDAGD